MTDIAGRLREPLDIKFREGLSEGVKELIRCILKLAPGDRPAVSDIMRHPWLERQRLMDECDARAAGEEDSGFGSAKVQCNPAANHKRNSAGVAGNIREETKGEGRL